MTKVQEELMNNKKRLEDKVSDFIKYKKQLENQMKETKTLKEIPDDVARFMSGPFSMHTLAWMRTNAILTYSRVRWCLLFLRIRFIVLTLFVVTFRYRKHSRPE